MPPSSPSSEARPRKAGSSPARPQQATSPEAGTAASAARRAGSRRRRRVAGMVLTPGAGAGRDHPALVAIDDALSAQGVRVVRVDFPYRLAGRRAPDKPPVLIRTIVEAAEQLARDIGVPGRQVALGGRSMGGRMCSMAVAEGLAAAALVLVSYPLHPPGRPESARTAHLPDIAVPCLFVSGTRDAFGSPDELEAAATAIPAPVTHVWIERGDHGLRGRDGEVATSVAEWVGSL